MSSKEHRTGTSSGVGLAKQMVGEFVFCFPVMDHSFSTSMGFFLGGGCCLCHGNFEESCRKPLSGKMNTGDKSLLTV